MKNNVGTFEKRALRLNVEGKIKERVTFDVRTFWLLKRPPWKHRKSASIAAAIPNSMHEKIFYLHLLGIIFMVYVCTYTGVRVYQISSFASLSSNLLLTCKSTYNNNRHTEVVHNAPYAPLFLFYEIMIAA